MKTLSLRLVRRYRSLPSCVEHRGRLTADFADRLIAQCLADDIATGPASPHNRTGSIVKSKNATGLAKGVPSLPLSRPMDSGVIPIRRSMAYFFIETYPIRSTRRCVMPKPSRPMRNRMALIGADFDQGVYRIAALAEELSSQPRSKPSTVAGSPPDVDRISMYAAKLRNVYQFF